MGAELFCVEKSSARASCIPLLLSDLQRFLCRLEKGRTLDALCVLNKEDSMDIFTQVPNVNSWAALFHLWFFPRVFKAVAPTEGLWPQSIWHSISLITRRQRMHWDLTYRYLFDKIYLSQRLTKSTAKKYSPIIKRSKPRYILKGHHSDIFIEPSLLSLMYIWEWANQWWSKGRK